MYGFGPFPPPPKHAKVWSLYLVGSIAIDLGLLLGLILYGGFSLATVIDDVIQYRDAQASRGWNPVVGKIISSGTIQQRSGHAVVANYSYEVGGQTFAGTRVIFSAMRPVASTEAEALQLLSPFGRLSEENELSGIFDGIIPKADRRVTVYYDPASPENSTLRQAYFANPNLSDLWPALPISAFLMAILLWSVRSWWCYIAKGEYKLAERSRLPK